MAVAQKSVAGQREGEGRGENGRGKRGKWKRGGGKMLGPCRPPLVR
jgi:hypothetical protein